MALGVLSFWIVILSLPMLSGQFLAGPFSDQYSTGYAFRHWAAGQWGTTGAIPLWNPTIFGGIPFVAAMHGDIFYPTAWLRLIMPTEVAMNIGFAVHYVLAGFFMYLFLRKLRISWFGSVVGGLCYQLSGVIGTYAAPGHDGKLFVTALLPLGLLALLIAIRDRRLEGYAILALTTGLVILSPQIQMAYYFLLTSGLFSLYLTFGECKDRKPSDKLKVLGLAFVAVVVGFGVATIQLLPFYSYIPFSPRAEIYGGGFESSASYAIPWSHVPEFFFAGFVGDRLTYWGSNPLKLHSEYLGLSVLALAFLGALGRRRQIVIWLGGMGLLFLLISLGASTPFYRIWWEVMPYVKQTRAPGMALYVVSFVIGLFAAFGVERLELGEGKHHASVWVWVGTAVAVFGLVGVLGTVAQSLAASGEFSQGRVAQAVAASDGIRWGAFWGGSALAVAGISVLLAVRNRLGTSTALLIIGLAASADLWMNSRSFWSYSRPDAEVFAPDAVQDYLEGVEQPFRVFDIGFPLGRASYPGSALMARGVNQVFGHHGNELRHFDELWGGKNQWTNWGNSNLWDLYAIEYLLVPSSAEGLDSIAGFELVLRDAITAPGVVTNVFRRSQVQYARLIPGAVVLPESQVIPTVLDQRFPLQRVVVFDEAEDLAVEPFQELPAPLDIDANVTDWQPGSMTITFADPAPQKSYLLVSENYYPDWKATVDGVETPVFRGNHSLITVPVPQGARTVELRFESAEYRIGKRITFASLFLVLIGFVVPVVRRRKGG